MENYTGFWYIRIMGGESRSHPKEYNFYFKKENSSPTKSEILDYLKNHYRSFQIQDTEQSASRLYMMISELNKIEESLWICLNPSNNEKAWGLYMDFCVLDQKWHIIDYFNIKALNRKDLCGFVDSSEDTFFWDCDDKIKLKKFSDLNNQTSSVIKKTSQATQESLLEKIKQFK